MWSLIVSGNQSEYYQTNVPYTQYQATATYNDPQWAAAVRYGAGGIISKSLFCIPSRITTTFPRVIINNIFYFKINVFNKNAFPKILNN